MKINWFSPLPPAKTGIANYTLRVLPALSELVEVVLWTTQTDWSQEIEQYGTVRHYCIDSMPWKEVHQADLNLYHMGNNFLYHSQIWQVTQCCTGLVILHDSRLQHFFATFYESQGKRQSYLAQMKRYYGQQGEQTLHDFWKGIISIDSMAEHYPLTSLALQNSVGVITHNRQVYQQLQQEYSQLTGYIPLAYSQKLQLLNQEKHKGSPPPYQLIIFGHIGTNRRIESVLDALATFAEKESFKLDIYGELWDETYIKQYISRLNLEQQVTIRGFVSEEELEIALAQADLAINLRYPSMGEASISQLQIWSHALPSLVTQTNWYADIPQDTVVFVRPDHEIEDIHRNLENFLNKPELYREMGRKGQKYLEYNHHPQVYVQSLLDIVTQACSLRHRGIMDRLTDRVGREVSYWHLLSDSRHVLKNVAGAIHFLIV